MNVKKLVVSSLSKYPVADVSQRPNEKACAKSISRISVCNVTRASRFVAEGPKILITDESSNIHNPNLFDDPSLLKLQIATPTKYMLMMLHRRLPAPTALGRLRPTSLSHSTRP